MLRVWGLDFALDKHSDVSVHTQITLKVIKEIKRGRLKPKVAMPGSRKLADTLGVNRKTVLLAYTELVAQGWLTTEKNRGTFVSEKLPDNLEKKTHDAESDWDLMEQQGHLDVEHSFFSPQENVVKFNDGDPDTRLLPFEIIARAFRRALIVSGRSNKLSCQDPLGMLSLRQAVLHMLSMQRSLNANLENICIVRGSQMGIYLAAKLLVHSDDYIALEKLTLPSARNVFQSFSANVVNISTDQEGINVDELEALCQKVQLKAVYVTPHHQYPTTVMMSRTRRLRLLKLAEQYDFYIIEDDYAHEFHFSDEPVFPLASYGNSDRILHIGSLSKILAPGLRLGYLVASSQLISQCADEIMMIDIQGNLITEMAVSELMDTGELKRHVLKATKVYEDRRNKLELLIRQELSEFVDFNVPVGGLAFWIKFKQLIHIREFVAQAKANKLLIAPAAIFSNENEQIEGIRLGFASLNSKELEQGISRLKKTLIDLQSKTRVKR
jgi:GntR family transcriptional regulator/MocR family aminotransferase